MPSVGRSHPTHLSIRLAAVEEGLRVIGHLSGPGAEVDAGEVMCQMRSSVAGAPSVEMHADAIETHDEDGLLPLTADMDESGLRRWRTGRATRGAVSFTYLARPTDGWPSSPTPPLELRREEQGLSGALKCLLLDFPSAHTATFDLSYVSAEGVASSLSPTAVSSLGELDGEGISGEGLDLLLHTYLMCGEEELPHHAASGFSTWWLTPSAFDTSSFTEQLGGTYAAMANVFDAPTRPYRVFLRATPHRGISASAHPASFVAALDPTGRVDDRRLERTVAHELVHEWVQLDGASNEVTWFNEGVADYYSLLVPFREGLIDEHVFLSDMNTAARMGFANPFYDLTLDAAAELYWSDFRAHRLPYARGMFYLADLDERLRMAGLEPALDDLVRRVVASRFTGAAMDLPAWCAVVDGALGGDEAGYVEDFVFAGHGRPGRVTFGSALDVDQVQIPILEPGFGADTYPTRRLQGLVPGGPADLAGLEEGDELDLPTYEDAVNLDVGQHLHLKVLRHGAWTPLALGLGDRFVTIPQWCLRT